VITITGSSDHDRPELMITFAGIRRLATPTSISTRFGARLSTSGAAWPQQWAKPQESLPPPW
jgi:hypothetical protein